MAFKIKQGKYTHMSISVSELLKKEWPPHADEKLLWLAGYLESEGWFGIRKRISGIQSALAKLSFTTTDKDIADKVATLLDTKLYIRKPQKEYYKVGYLGIIDGKKLKI